MLTIAAVIFAVAAVGGLILALHVLRNKFAPWALSILHALLGATGLVLLLAAVAQGLGGSLATAALAIFVVAALGGFYLASLHHRQVIAPKAVVILHALLAVSGFGLLLAVLVI